MFHHLLTIHYGTRARVGLFILLASALSLAVWAHIKTGDSALHQIVFGSMIVTVGLRMFKLLKTMISDQNMRSKLQQLATRGYLLLAAGYALWLIDVFACPYLRAIRQSVGLPLAWLFELHGWWHILTAAGVYVYMLLGEYLQPAHRNQKLSPDSGWISLLKGPFDPQDDDPAFSNAYAKKTS
ncbi:hypothetical protein LOZ53_003409 [Ophidiomyces ophidiicola]|uniref:Uncharacterized protein n=1 Tax=Ophidiomyces ophidiicola TaxID=1387563 RepID=A0ACB8UZQ3_9EURO|nr:uncharacterized protein LOZ57_002333 [Ophidiomyces ophidiicola]KAI1913445.1 hypothetical protein LOZ61_002778 [Ophidiomyces ophidiicola]KAI1919663.1 hypothetical protein LOZ64_002171 [Ophidiomyces ophidiicola]KAI1928116.1 hypothetical protein LOZ60_002609 [Ophidiomyces ophidiicola]KAI1945389.1 hypothetical protein LOZ62_003792 [Ophidiomyces ophidiicola]KAI1949855.1 hypothetical protein LOZ57_002333 [Ophidiomyces ophidiicola]